MTHVGGCCHRMCGQPQTAQLTLELARRGGTIEFFGVCPIGEKIQVEPNQVYLRN